MLIWRLYIVIMARILRNIYIGGAAICGSGVCAANMYNGHNTPFPIESLKIPEKVFIF